MTQDRDAARLRIARGGLTQSAVEDDAGLSGLVGPGDGWTEEELEPGITLSYGWRGGSFKVEIDADAVPAAAVAGAALEGRIPR